MLHYGRRVVYAEADVEDPKRKIIARGVASFLIIKNTAGKGEKG